MSYFELESKPIKVHQAEIIHTESDQPAGTIIRADKEGIQVATGKNILNLQVIQLSGKKAMPVQDILNSRKELFSVGTQLKTQGEKI